jgi:hypothetical protein
MKSKGIYREEQQGKKKYIKDMDELEKSYRREMDAIGEMPKV